MYLLALTVERCSTYKNDDFICGYDAGHVNVAIKHDLLDKLDSHIGTFISRLSFLDMHPDSLRTKSLDPFKL